MRRVILGALVLILLGIVVTRVTVASDLDALWMSETAEGSAQTDFPSGIQTVYVVFEYTDFVFENVRVVVSNYKGTVVFEQTQTFVGSGIASIPVSNGQTAFPDGPYVTTLYYAGQYLTRAVEWTVGGVDSPPTPTAFPPARLEVQPTALTFAAVQGGSNPSTQRVLISNNTVLASAWRATTDAPWVELSTNSGQTPFLLHIGVDNTGLPAGTYTGRVTVTADSVDGSPQRVDIIFTVSPPEETTTLDVPTVAAGTGWVVSDEPGGNHFGQGEIWVGVQAGQKYLGAVQFDLSEIPDESNIRAAAVVLTGARWEAEASAGVWVLEVLSGDLADGWSDRSYADIATATVRVALVPDQGVENLGAGVENVWYLDTAGLDILESLVRDVDSAVLRLRYEPPVEAADEGLFVWQAAGLLRVNFEAGTAPVATDTPPAGTATPTESATNTPPAGSVTPTATPGVPPPPPPPGRKQPPGVTLAWMLTLLGAFGAVVQRLARIE
ncbi:MAG: hypothetical protein ACE5HA_10395 [Anaerolineae bacterium]